MLQREPGRVIHEEYFESFNLLPTMLGMLTLGTVIVFNKSNYLSESEIGQSYLSQCSLYNVDAMKHSIGGKMAQGVPFCPRVGAKRSNSIFFNFPYISKIYPYMLTFRD